MELLKRHLFLIICGVVAAASIALGALGIGSMSKVQDELQQAAQLASDLQRGGRDPVNIRHIRAERERIDETQTNYEQVMEWVSERNRYEPLIPDAFPEPTRDQRLAFREAYGARLQQLFDMLDPGTVASSPDIAEMEEQIDEEIEAARAFDGVDLDEIEDDEELPTQQEEETGRVSLRFADRLRGPHDRLRPSEHRQGPPVSLLLRPEAAWRSHRESSTLTSSRRKSTGCGTPSCPSGFRRALSRPWPGLTTKPPASCVSRTSLRGSG